MEYGITRCENVIFTVSRVEPLLFQLGQKSSKTEGEPDSDWTHSCAVVFRSQDSEIFQPVQGFCLQSLSQASTRC